MDNIVFIEFYNKERFPKGKWSSEPDVSRWFMHGMPCLAIRDMSIGTWKGFVGIDISHPFHAQDVPDLLNINAAIEIFLSVHGGICTSGALPAKYNEFNQNFWWIGIDTSHGGDFLPFLAGETNIQGNQSYKDFKFIRTETNKLAKHLLRIK
jgi:hypothetical protein